MIKRMLIGAALLVLMLTSAVATQPPIPRVDESQTGGTIIQIETHEDALKDWLRYKVTVLEDESGNPLAGVIVKIVKDGTNEEASPAITGASGGYQTNEKGELVFKIYPSPIAYVLRIAHTGYIPYQSGAFALTEDGEVTVRLKKEPTTPGTDYKWVTYMASPGGSFDGEQTRKEQVLRNNRPKKVPTPTPEPGYVFAHWLQGTTEVTPSGVRIWRDTTFYAVFHPLAPVDPETPEPDDKTDPTEPPAIIPPGEIPTQPGGIDGNGGGGNNPNPENTNTNGNQGNDNGDGTPVNPGTVTDPAEPTVPAFRPDEQPEPPPTESTVCCLHWWILLCVLLTLLLSGWRLLVIRKHMKEADKAPKKEEVTVP